jgi:hypothetical protein
MIGETEKNISGEDVTAAHGVVSDSGLGRDEVAEGYFLIVFFG